MIGSSEETKIVDEAHHRYMCDAEFHNRVDLAVLVTSRGWDNAVSNRGERNAAKLTVAVALNNLDGFLSVPQIHQENSNA